MIQSIEITKWRNATQMASRVNDHETGFADILIHKEEVYADLNTNHYYIVMIISGEVNASCKLYKNKLITSGHQGIGRHEYSVVRVHYYDYPYRQ